MAATGSVCFGLLAGGQSQRMGVDKATVVWRGRPLWQHQLRLAAEIGADEILISGKRDGPYRDAARVVPDEIAGCGPIGGLVSLLGAMTSEWLALVAVDMPFLDALTLNRLLEERRKGRGVVPCVSGRFEPLSAVYPRTALEFARVHAASVQHSMQAFVREAEAAGLIRLFTWEAERAECFRSLNTPEEWAQAGLKSVFRDSL